MADIELDHLWQRRDLPRRVIVKPMPGVTFDAERGGLLGGALQPREFGRGPFAGAIGHGIAPGPGMEFDRRRADRARRFDRRRLWLDEQGNDDPGTGQFAGEGAQMIVAADNIETTLGRALLAPLGHEAGRMRLHRQSHIEHLDRGCHLEIQRFSDVGLEALHIVVADMAAVFAQMRGNAVSAGFDRNKGRAQRVRNRAAARIPQRRHMIDIDAKPQMRSAHPFTRSTLLTTGLVRNSVMRPFKCFRSGTSTSMMISRKSGEIALKEIVSILAPVSPIAIAMMPRVPGSLMAVTRMRAGNRLRLPASRSQRTSSQRSG